THALLPLSTAINAGNPTFAPPTDQRGVARSDGGPDIGAFEAPQLVIIIGGSGGGSGGGSTAVFPPLANAGGPYTVPEGGSVQLDASGTTDPAQDPATLTYAWDLDGDGVFGETGAGALRGDEVGIAPRFSAASLDGPASMSVALRVTNSVG